jgi:indolepyruvate decarboxylase
MTITIADCLLTRLAELGMHHTFGLPGDFNLWFLEQMSKNSNVTFIGCCNELNAAYAADGCARLAGVSALATTYGVAELASLAGVAGAYAERVPIVCIPGAPPINAMREGALLHHTLAHGNFDNMLTCYREFTTAQARIEPTTARSEIDRVLRTCWLEKRPVYLQLPSDVAGVRIAPITRPLDLNPPCSNPRQLARAISQISARLSRANHPAILLDADVDRFGLTEPVIALAEANDIPIAHLIPAKGVISDTHPLSIGIYRGAASSPTVRAAVEDSDCLLCFGPRFTDVASCLFTHTISPDSVIDLQPFSVRLEGEFFSAVVAKELLSGLLATTHRTVELSSRPLPRPTTRTESETSGALTQAVLWRHIQKYLKQGDVIVSDTGTSFFASANLNLPDGVSFIAQPIWGSLGYALPAALGTSLAAPDRRQLVFLGDGAFQMTVQELSTILRLNLNPIIFLLNNNGYTIERLILGSESSYNDISPWQYSEVPAAFDTRNRAVVHVVRTEAELEAALHAGRDVSKLHLIELVLPRMDAPEALVRFARKAAAFDFPQMRDGNESETNADCFEESALLYR